MSDKNRKKIIDAAIVAYTGNHMASMEDIAEAAGVGRATLYRLFKSKKELICTLSLEAGKRIDEAVSGIDFDGSGIEVLKELVKECVPVGAEFHFLNYEPFYFDDPDVNSDYRKSLSLLEDVIIKLQKEGAYAKSLPVIWGARCLDMLIWTVWSSVKEGDIAPNSAVDLVVRTFLNGGREV